ISSCYIHACASVVRQQVAALLDAMLADHERSTGPWEIEWIALPEAFLLSAGALNQAKAVVGGLEVDAKRMRANLDSTKGVVVLALRGCDVEGHDDGFSCLLWAPPTEGTPQWVDRPSRQERLEHCRLALVHGGADGLLVCGDAGLVEPDAILALRVEKRR